MLKKPPSLTMAQLESRYPDFRKNTETPEFADFIRVANERYFSWEEMRRRPLPDSVGAEVAWTILRAQRKLNSHSVPIKDKFGQSFQFWLPDVLLKTLSQIDRQAGGAILSDDSVGISREKYVLSSLMDEAISSSQLEGAATTRVRAKEMLRSGDKPRDKSERMIWNNWQTMRRLRDLRNTPLTPDGILEIHTLTTRDTLDDPADAGRLRTHDDVVVSDIRTGETLHVPPSHNTLAERLQQLCDFANNDEPWIHPVAKAAMLHFWLGYDHPFVDGNGRTARALFYWYLLSNGYWLFEYLSISRYVLQAPIQYSQAFCKTELDGGDLTYFLHFNLRVVQLALDELHRDIERKTRELAAARHLDEMFGDLNARQRSLVAHARRYATTQYTIEAHRASHGVSYRTARGDLLDLAQRGLLIQRQRGKAFVFTPAPRLLDN